jgi:hypothetical protein
MPAPPMPFLPEEQHGRPVIFALIVYAGDIEVGERAVAPFRALAEPLADMVGPKPYPAIFEGFGGEEDFHPLAAMRTMFVDGIDRSAAETIVEQLQVSTALIAVTQLRVLGGAAARVPADATAYAHRQSRIMVNVAALFGTPDEAPEHEPWVNGLADALRQDDQGAYVNFLGDEGEERIRAAYPGETWDRLVAVKRRYDPTNLFRLNQNISPRLSGHPVGSEVRASQRSSVRANLMSVWRVWRSDRPWPSRSQRKDSRLVSMCSVAVARAWLWPGRSLPVSARRRVRP